MKTNFFKNTIGLFLLSLLLCSTDCTNDPLIFRDYTIKNTTNHSASIKFYQTIFFTDGNSETEYVKRFDFVLKKGEKSERIDYQTVESDLKNRNSFIRNAFKFSDSAVIIFDNTKRLTYNFTFQDFESQDRHIFNDMNYIKNEEGEYVFDIKEDDYKNAIDCNGSCE